jgi:hypothetical protein
MKKQIILATLLAGASVAAQAYTQGGYPYELKNNGGSYFITLSNEDGSGTRPNCHTSEQWSFRTQGAVSPEMARLLDWVVAENQPVYVIGTGECAGSIETIKAIEVLNMGVGPE